MGKIRHRFESEVHLGLLVIIFVLLLLNFVSNYIVFRTRMGMQESVAAGMRSSALAIVRVVQSNGAVELTDQQRRELRQKHSLADLLVIPAPPRGVGSSEYRAWFRKMINGLSPSAITDLSEKLLKAEPEKLTRGLNSEYLFVSPVTVGPTQKLVILAREAPELAALEDAGRLLLQVGEGGIALVALFYLLVARSIFAPFRKIRQRALEAGRPMGSAKGEVEDVIADYQRIIAELQEKETELRRLNAVIQERADSLEEFNRYLLRSVDSGIITLDLDGRVLTLSDVAGRILDLDPVDCLGDSVFMVLDRSKPLGEAIRATLETREAPGYQEYEFTLSNGHVAVIGVAVSVIRNAEHRPIGVSILVNDLTELSSLRTQLEQKNRLEALGEMAGGLAHQLRNSMGAIVGYGTLVKKKLNKGESGQSLDAADCLLREAHEAETLIGKFLTFARPFNYNPEPTRLRTLIEETLDGFRLRDDCRAITFLLESTEDPELSADPVLLKQALTNLVENAIHAYGNRTGEVRLSLRTESDRVAIEVRDRGCGIAPEAIRKIFTPFYSSRPAGTGLGLPLASRIVDLHGGTIIVDSQVGVGTTFHIVLPLHAGVLTDSSVPVATR